MKGDSRLRRNVDRDSDIREGGSSSENISHLSCNLNSRCKRRESKRAGLNKDTLSSLPSGANCAETFQFCIAQRDTLSAADVGRARLSHNFIATSRRAWITATPLKMDFIKAILPGDRCRKKGENPPKGMRPLPLADPLRMIITSRRLNFAPLSSASLPVPILVAPKVRRRSGLHPSLPSSPPPVPPTLTARPPLSPLPSFLDYSERPPPLPPPSSANAHP